MRRPLEDCEEGFQERHERRKTTMGPLRGISINTNISKLYGGCIHVKEG